MESKNSQIARQEFSARLIASLKDAGCPSTFTAFAREFNLRANGDEVTVHAARKWLKGESLPTHERLSLIARWLRVSPQWLRYGEGAKVTESLSDSKNVIPPHEVRLLSDFRLLDGESQAIVCELLRSLLKLRRKKG